MASIHRVSAIIAYVNGSVASYASIHDGDTAIQAPEDATEFATLEAELYSFPNFRSFIEGIDSIVLDFPINIDHIASIAWSVDMEDETGRSVISGFEANGEIGSNTNSTYNSTTYPNFNTYIDAIDIDPAAATATATMRPSFSSSSVAPGANYRVGQTLTLVGGTFTTVAAGTVASVSSVAGQDETDFVLGELNGTFAPGTGYDALDTITLSEGTVITVDSVGTAGDILTFTVTSASTSGFSNDATLTQSSTSGIGTGFTLTLDDLNQGVFGMSFNQTAEVPDGEYSVLPSNPVSTTTGGSGSGATFTVTWAVRNVTVTDGGDGYDTAPAVAFTGNATGTTTLSGDEVFSVTVVFAGSGYTAVAVVTIAGPSA